MGLRVLTVITLGLTLAVVLVFFVLFGAQESQGELGRVSRRVSTTLVLVGVGSFLAGVVSFVGGLAFVLLERPGGLWAIFVGVIAVIVGAMGFLAGGLYGV